MRIQRTRRTGSYAILLAVSLMVILAFAAIAIDLSYVRMARFQAQNAADAGAHAALVELRNSGDAAEAEAVAQAIVTANFLAGSTAALETGDVTFGAWDYELRSFDDGASYINAVQVRVHRDDSSSKGPISLFIGPIRGQDYAEASSAGRAIGALRYREIMVVMDITGSFGNEFPDARAAALTLLDYLADNDFPSDRIGLATFVAAGELWDTLSYIDTDYYDIRYEWAQMDWCDRSYPPWETYYGGAYYHEAPLMMQCCAPNNPAYNPSDSGTAQGAGLEVAIDHLLDEESANPQALKTIILISDGRPQCLGGSSSWRAQCEAERAAYGVAMADWAHENNISLFSVSFNDPFNATQSAYMESLIRGYGKFYETPDETELPDILLSIAQSIPIALVE